MIKYLTITGYENCGELGMFSHIYEFIGKDENHIVLLIRAFDVSKAKVFKGRLLTKTKQYESRFPLTEEEKTSLENIIGEIQECNPMQVTEGSPLEKELIGYSEIQS